MKRQKPFEKRHEYVREAEKDLAVALTSLHEGNLVRAALNGAIAMVRITGAMTDREADEMVQAAESIVALEKSRREKAENPGSQK